MVGNVHRFGQDGAARLGDQPAGLRNRFGV